MSSTFRSQISNSVTPHTEYFSCWKENIFFPFTDVVIWDLLWVSITVYIKRNVPYKYFRIRHAFGVWIWCWVCAYLKDGSPRNLRWCVLLFNTQSEHQRMLRFTFHACGLFLNLEQYNNIFLPKCIMWGKKSPMCIFFFIFKWNHESLKVSKPITWMINSFWNY